MFAKCVRRVPALLYNDRWQFLATDLVPDRVQSLAGHGESTDGVPRHHIESGRQDEITRIESVDDIQRCIQRVQVTRVIGALWKRPIPIIAFASALAALVSITPVRGKIIVGVRVETASFQCAAL